MAASRSSQRSKQHAGSGRKPEPAIKENEMKLIVAYIQPERLPAVKQALYEKEVFKMSVTNALGCGQQMGYHESYRGIDIEVNLLKKVRIEIAVNDKFVKPTLDAIIAGARTGTIGDGKIFVITLDECIRIRTGETGGDAIG
jgi:nitrogen regulatory protein P-II 2